MRPHPSSSQPRTVEKADVSPGDILAGKFRVERVVGRGGMGVVIEATNIQLDQRVALKLLAAGADDPSVVERFNREARAAARLRSEHVARVYDVGKDTLHGPFIVMELLEGKTLAEVITSTGRVQMHRAVEYVIDACEGLAEAHARGIVHQDVKPANLFLVTGDDGRPTIKLLDFGIATMRSKERAVDTTSSHPASGTPAYLSPEQLRSSPPVDHRADIWALGCVLYELLVGERAFRAARFTELVTKILEGPPDPIPDDLQIPPQLAAVIERSLQKDPSKRFASTGELALTLLPFARRRAHSAVARAVAHVKSGGLDPGLQMPSSMPPPPSDGSIDLASSANLRAPSVPSFSTGPSAAPAHQPSAPPATTPPRSRRGLVLVGLPLLLLLVVGIAAWMRSGSRGPVGATTGSPPIEPPSAAPNATASATPSATSPAIPAASTSASSATSIVIPRPPAPPPPRWATAATAATAPTAPHPAKPPSAPVQPTSTDSEIRHNR